MALDLEIRMISLSPLRAHQASPAEFLAFIVTYMELLLARWECIDRGRRPGLKPVTLARFHELGVNDDILLWMLFHDHIEHLKFVPSQKKKLNRRKQRKQREALSPFSLLSPVEIQPGRCKHAESLTLTDQSCFALNDKGAAFADAFLADALLPQFEGAFEDAWQKLIMGLLVPAYNHDERVFT